MPDPFFSGQQISAILIHLIPCMVFTTAICILCVYGNLNQGYSHVIKCDGSLTSSKVHIIQYWHSIITHYNNFYSLITALALTSKSNTMHCLQKKCQVISWSFSLHNQMMNLKGSAVYLLPQPRGTIFKWCLPSEKPRTLTGELPV